MPICKREGLDIQAQSVDNLNDDDEVFYCETTKEIFRNYNDYFERIMLINSTIWACEYTGRENLTYAEALKSERKSRNLAKSFKEILRAPVFLAVKKAQQSTHTALLNIIYQFMKDRYFRGEIVTHQLPNRSNKSRRLECKILEIITPNHCPENGLYPPADIKYKIQKVGSKNRENIFTVRNNEIRRRRFDLTHDNLLFFLKENCELSQGILVPKADMYKKYVTDPGITFESLFIGNMPDWIPRPKKVITEKEKVEKSKPSEKLNGAGAGNHNKEKKQETLSKYLVKKNGNNIEQPKDDKEIERVLKERLEKLRMEREKQQAELQRIRLEQQQRVDRKLIKFFTKCDDLERDDQKPLPLYKPIKIIIPIKYFGDVMYIKEFVQIFSQIIPQNSFRNTISFYELFRAFSVREVAGPLSEILQLLLHTIFQLQRDEEEECHVNYIEIRGDHDTIRATNVHRYVKKHYSRDLNELPLDAVSVSEILRLHLLGSGARSDEKSQRWRWLYRNGYDPKDDPGRDLTQRTPHILRALKSHPFYELPLRDIFKVLNCLINQILTYSAALNIIDERFEALSELRNKRKEIKAAESKRFTNIILQKKMLSADLMLRVNETADLAKKKQVEEEILRKIERLETHDVYEKDKFATELNFVDTQMFDYALHLGTDRAYRNYYIFDSVPGVFIEHIPECYDVCLENPPKNDYIIARCPNNRKDMKAFFLKQVIEEDKENAKLNLKNSVEANKENNTFVKNAEMGANTTRVNGTTIPITLPNGGVIGLITKPELPSTFDLYMCSGDPRTCIVHNEQNSLRMQWSYLNTPEQLEDLIESLNPNGQRESTLKQQLIWFKPLILKHLTDFPEDALSVDDTGKEAFKERIMSKTFSKFKQANMGFDNIRDLNVIMYTALVEEILNLEMNISCGGLGKIKVADLEKWRTDLKNNSYNSQCAKLEYAVECDKKLEEPGENLGDTIDIESEDSSDEGISLYDSPELLRSVKDLASALLQIEQGIDYSSLKPPFGPKNDNVKPDHESVLAGRNNLKYWERSLMISTSYSQVYLHLCVLNKAIKWFKKLACCICSEKTAQNQILLCDNCNEGTHMFCLKPKLKKVPEGNWYCKKCEDVQKHQQENGAVQKKKIRKRIFKINFDEEEIEERENDFGKDIYSDKEKTEDSEVDDDRTCITCFVENPKMLKCQCTKCKSWYHIRCAHLKSVPTTSWFCGNCRRKRKFIESDKESVDSDSDALPKPVVNKRVRTRAFTADEDSDSSEPQRILRSKSKPSPQTTRSNRRAAKSENLPLNSALLYSLLNDIMKHEDAWPFIRPVKPQELPDYYKIVTKPMDFAKIKSNLNMGRYTLNEELLKDIELVFLNCDLYDAVGSDVYNAGVSLEKFVIKKCKELHLPYTPSELCNDSD